MAEVTIELDYRQTGVIVLSLCSVFENFHNKSFKGKRLGKCAGQNGTLRI